jgi:hypothetical protein
MKATLWDFSVQAELRDDGQYRVVIVGNRTGERKVSRSEEEMQWTFKKAVRLEKGQFPGHKLGLIKKREREKAQAEAREALINGFVSAKKGEFSKGLFALSSTNPGLRQVIFTPLIGRLRDIVLSGQIDSVADLRVKGKENASPSADDQVAVLSYIREYLRIHSEEIENLRAQLANPGASDSGESAEGRPASLLDRYFQYKGYYDGDYRGFFKTVAFLSVGLEWLASFGVYHYGGMTWFTAWIIDIFARTSSLS